MKQKPRTSITRRRQRRTGAGLLYRGSTKGAPPPRARRQHRRGAPPGRGRAREDLFPLSAAAAVVSPPTQGNQTLDLLGPILQPPPTGVSTAVSPTSRRLWSHRRRKGPPAPPPATPPPLFALPTVARQEVSREDQGTRASIKAGGIDSWWGYSQVVLPAPVRVQLVKGPCSCVRSPKRNPSRLSFVPSSVWCVASFSLVIIKKVTTRRVKNIRREKRNYSQHSLLSL